jgi:hypothetical protein
MTKYEVGIHGFLYTMPYDRRYSVKPEQVETIKGYMRENEWQGGLSFSADYKTIYKTRIPK